MLFEGGFLMVALATAAVIAVAVRHESPLLRPVLSVGPLCMLGVVSYGVYLYHWPLYWWLTSERLGFSGLPLVAVRIVATLALATASFFLIERPIRRGSSIVSLRVLTPVAATLTVAVVLLATAGAPATAKQSALFARAAKQLAASTPAGSTQLLVVGDGSAFVLGDAVGNTYRAPGFVGLTFASLSCGLAEGKILFAGHDPSPLSACTDWPDQYPAVVDAFHPDAVALMVGNREVFSRVVDDETIRFGTDAMERQLGSELDRARTALTSRGGRMFLLTLPCPPSEPGPSTQPEQLDPRRVAWVNGVFRRYAETHPGVRVADLGSVLCGNAAYRDRAGRITHEGALATWRWLATTSQQPAG
jgi:hypothetical protein